MKKISLLLVFSWIQLVLIAVSGTTFLANHNNQNNWNSLYGALGLVIAAFISPFVALAGIGHVIRLPKQAMPSYFLCFSILINAGLTILLVYKLVGAWLLNA
jgi:uncharacterized membrane protein